MTVCIAAACEDGEKIVTATDGLLSLGDVTGECLPGKMRWFGDWQFMYAGTPATFALVMEEISKTHIGDSEALSRLRIQGTVLEAYRAVRSRLASFEVLSPFGISIQEFLASGVEPFGESPHDELIRQISYRGSQLQDQLLVLGWGLSDHSAMLYEIGPSGDSLHEAAGFTAIGSGSQMAHTMLLLLGQARHRKLADTIFNVACAKFFSEKSGELDVGKATTIYVQRKRTAEDNTGGLCGDFVSFEDIDKLRCLWTEYLKPRIPDEARSEINQIAARMNSGRISFRDMAEHITASQRMAAKNAPATQEASQAPQPTTGDPLPPQPSPPSPIFGQSQQGGRGRSSGAADKTGRFL